MIIRAFCFFCTIILLFSCKSIGQQSNVYKAKNLMVIFAHPDDEIVIAPILSKYAKQGVIINVVFVTDGSKGVTSHANIPAGQLLTKVRYDEARCVSKTLGINPPIFLNYTDGDLVLNENIYSLDDKIDSLLKKHQPNVVITFGPDGEYGHTDHRIVSNIVTEVFQREASQTMTQLLYYGFPKEDINTNIKLKTNVGNWFNQNWKTSQKRFLTYRIPYNEDDLKLGYEAASCHKSQYTTENVDDIFSIMNQTKGLICFRAWNGSNAIKDNIFE